MAFLLDSNTVIYFFKNAGQVREHVRQHEDQDFKLCTPVLWELLTGANKARDSSAQHARLALFQARFELLPFDQKPPAMRLKCAPSSKPREHPSARWTP